MQTCTKSAIWIEPFLAGVMVGMGVSLVSLFLSSLDDGKWRGLIYLIGVAAATILGGIAILIGLRYNNCI